MTLDDVALVCSGITFQGAGKVSAIAATGVPGTMTSCPRFEYCGAATANDAWGEVLSMTESESLATPSELKWISYGEFGAQFFGRAVTTERITSAVVGLAGRGIKIGPFEVGPAGLAGVDAEGSIGTPTVAAREGADVAFDLLVPASLVVVVRLGQEFRLEADVEIDLVLVARAAEELRIVIDIPAITDRDVRLVVRADALGADRGWILDPVRRVIRAEVAKRLNAMLADAETTSGRIFDVGAMIDGTEEDKSATPGPAWIADDEFGQRFFRHAVTEARIAAAVAELSGRTVDIAPMKTGPRDLATVSAKGRVRTPGVAPRAGEHVCFDVTVPVALDLLIAFGGDKHYQAEIDIPLVLTARAADPLLIVVDVPPPDPDDIAIALKSKGLGAAMLRKIGGVKKQMREQVAAVVTEELTDASGRTVDIAARIDGA